MHRPFIVVIFNWSLYYSSHIINLVQKPERSFNSQNSSKKSKKLNHMPSKTHKMPNIQNYVGKPENNLRQKNNLILPHSHWREEDTTCRCYF